MLPTAQNVHNRLYDLIKSDVLTVEDRSRAETLASNLKRPIRIFAVGHRGSGKTTVLNAFMHEPVSPNQSTAKIIELTRSQASVSLAGDIAHESSPFTSGIVEAHRATEETEHVLYSSRSDRLTDLRLVNVTLPENDETSHQIIEWVGHSADIVIWCTKNIDPNSFPLWQNIPDVLKDHSLLALTFADVLMAQRSLEGMVNRFQGRIAEDFMGLYPIATRHALASCSEGRIVDPTTWAASGGQALTTAIDRIVQSARQADLDYAEVLMARYPASGNDTAQAPTAETQEPSIMPMMRNEAIATALTVLQAPVDELLRATGSEAPSPSYVLDHTTQAAQALATLLMDTNTDDPDISTFRENVLEYEQMALLMQVEGTEKAANDAVTALLQLKKEMSEVAYA